MKMGGMDDEEGEDEGSRTGAEVVGSASAEVGCGAVVEDGAGSEEADGPAVAFVVPGSSEVVGRGVSVFVLSAISLLTPSIVAICSASSVFSGHLYRWPDEVVSEGSEVEVEEGAAS